LVQTLHVMSMPDLIIDGTDMQRRVTGIILAVDVGAIVDQLLKKLHSASFTNLSLVIHKHCNLNNTEVLVNSHSR